MNSAKAEAGWAQAGVLGMGLEFRNLKSSDVVEGNNK